MNRVLAASAAAGALVLFGLARTSVAQTYFRASAADGSPFPFHDHLSGTPDEWDCWFRSRNMVLPERTTQGTCQYNTGELYWWSASPPSKHSSATTNVNFWVQGFENYGESMLFRGWSYYKNGDTAYATPVAYAPTYDFDMSLGNLSVAPYGTVLVILGFTALNPGETPSSRWAGFAYNYN